MNTSIQINSFYLKDKTKWQRLINCSANDKFSRDLDIFYSRVFKCCTIIYRGELRRRRSVINFYPT